MFTVQWLSEAPHGIIIGAGTGTFLPAKFGIIAQDHYSDLLLSVESIAIYWPH